LFGVARRPEREPYVSALSSIGNSFDADLELWDELGIDRVGLYLEKLEAVGVEIAAEHVRAAGLAVSSIAARGFDLDDPSTWDDRRASLDRAVDAATVVGAGCLFVTSGVPGTLDWDDSVRALEAAIEPVRDRAHELGVPLAIENSNPMRRDVGFTHTLPDTVEVARRLGVRVVFEVTNSWFERDLERSITDGADTFAVVQVSDYVVGDTTASERAVPGDGDVPLGRILGWVAAAGFAGPVELEMLGPRIEAEGYPAAIRRALAALGSVLAAGGPT
jgi:sugar phosphate isomerase/epimerase